MIFIVEIMSADIVQMLREGKQMNWLDHFQDENSKAHHNNDIDNGKRKSTLTEKGKQYRVSILNKNKKALVSRSNRKMNGIDVLLYTHESDVTVKEELQQLNDVFKLID